MKGEGKVRGRGVVDISGVNRRGLPFRNEGGNVVGRAMTCDTARYGTIRCGLPRTNRALESSPSADENSSFTSVPRVSLSVSHVEVEKESKTNRKFALSSTSRFSPFSLSSRNRRND